jgi:anti-sigma regulatory factor (Ser/Thr protein kinase)
MGFSSAEEEQHSFKPSSPPEVLTFATTSTPQAATLIRHTVDRFLGTRYPRSEAACELLIALGEAVANAIEHGASNKDITVKVVSLPSYVEVTVEDQGPGFSPNVPVIKSLPSVDSERGRGFPIIASCTDSLEIETNLGVGTRLIFTRKLR